MLNFSFSVSQIVYLQSYQALMEEGLIDEWAGEPEVTDGRMLVLCACVLNTYYIVMYFSMFSLDI